MTAVCCSPRTSNSVLIPLYDRAESKKIRVGVRCRKDVGPFISKHSEAEFSDGIHPVCVQRRNRRVNPERVLKRFCWERTDR